MCLYFHFIVLENVLNYGCAAEYEEDEEGEKFEFDSGDDAPEADRQPIQMSGGDLIDLGFNLPDPPGKLMLTGMCNSIARSPGQEDLQLRTCIFY